MTIRRTFGGGAVAREHPTSSPPTTMQSASTRRTVTCPSLQVRARVDPIQSPRPDLGMLHVVVLCGLHHGVVGPDEGRENRDEVDLPALDRVDDLPVLLGDVGAEAAPERRQAPGGNGAVARG